MRNGVASRRSPLRGREQPGEKTTLVDRQARRVDALHGKIAERIEERLQPLGIGTCAPYAALVDGLSNLLRAGGADRASTLVGPQASLFERQTQAVEQPADDRLGIADQRAVRQLDQLAICPASCVGERADIGSIMLPEVGQRISEMMPASEHLLVVREAAIDRIAPDIHDPCLGKNEPNEGDVAPIAVHLVDEEGLAAAPVPAGTL